MTNSREGETRMPAGEGHTDMILIIDDDIELCEMLQAYLAEEGFASTCTHSAAAGLNKVREEDPALVVLDVMLPDMNGFDVLSRIRAESPKPVIMLTGRGEEVDRVVGLEMGADDYVSKPFPLRELLARIRAVLRRSAATPPPAASQKTMQTMDMGPLHINPGAQSATVEGRPIHLTAAEFSILEQLVRAPGSVIERETLMKTALGRDPSFDDYVLNVHMSNLRRKLGSEVPIKTIRGRGYLLSTAPAES